MFTESIKANQVPSVRAHFVPLKPHACEIQSKSTRILMAQVWLWAFLSWTHEFVQPRPCVPRVCCAESLIAAPHARVYPDSFCQSNRACNVPCTALSQCPGTKKPVGGLNWDNPLSMKTPACRCKQARPCTEPLSSKSLKGTILTGLCLSARSSAAACEDLMSV
jgi:hypothetical protein